jgi:hypothetical protein
MRTVAQGREGFPGGVRQCSGKRRARSIRPFRGTRKGQEIEGDDDELIKNCSIEAIEASGSPGTLGLR